MTEKTSIKTINTSLNSMISDVPLQISLTVPSLPAIQKEGSFKNKPDGNRNIKKIPISIYLSKKQSKSQDLCSYVYCIGGYSLVLESKDETQLEFCNRLGKLISTRFDTPCYVGISYDQIQVVEVVNFTKMIINLIEENLLR